MYKIIPMNKHVLHAVRDFQLAHYIENVIERKRDEQDFVLKMLPTDIWLHSMKQKLSIVASSGKNVGGYVLASHPKYAKVLDFENEMIAISKSGKKIQKYVFIIQTCLNELYWVRNADLVLYAHFFKNLKERGYENVVISIPGVNPISIQYHEEIGFKKMFSTSDGPSHGNQLCQHYYLREL